MDQYDAEEWVVDTLEGHQIHTSVRQYLRKCMKNYTPPSSSTASRNGGASPPKPMEHCHHCDRPIQRGREILIDEKRFACQDCFNAANPAAAVVEKIATILGCELIYEDGEVEIRFEQAGIELSMWTSQWEPGIIAVAADPTEDPTWPEDEPLPDEPFRDRAVKVHSTGSRDYRADDAIAIAEAWRDALASTNEETTP
jgi:hypothetical protein